MGVVRTVRGDVAAEAIGPVMFHEHVLFDIVPPGATGDRDAEITPQNRWQINYRSNETPANAHQQDVAVAAAELGAFAVDGGSLIVDQSIAGLARDPEGLRAASEASGVHVVAAAGTYTAPYLPAETLAASAEALADLFTAEVTAGLDGTDVRAGLIGEIGCSWPMEPVEARALEAAAGAQADDRRRDQRPPRPPCRCVQRDPRHPGEAPARTFRASSSATWTAPIRTARASAPLLERGAVVEWDFFGIEQSHYWMGPVELPTDLGRLRLIDALAADGFGEQITISHDICTKTRLTRWGGHGYGHILRNVRPLMARLGFSPSLVAALCRDTPLRLLTLKEAV